MSDKKLGDTAEENVEYFRKTMMELQESMGTPVGGYPKNQMVVLIGGNIPRSIPTLIDIARFSLLEPEPKMNWSYVTERLKERPELVNPELQSTLNDPIVRNHLLVCGRTLGKSQVNNAWFRYLKQYDDARKLMKLQIRGALRTKTKKGPKRKTYPL